jgi:hypothetical protein
MKRVINGKLYNTETAAMVCEWSYSNRSDFNYKSEELYKTKKGAWFLFKEGGANGEARYFIEEHGMPEELESAFPGYIEEG